ncbi:MAG: hypothetical protein GY777_26295 [Candidatus Brocadiaceae bacterium]|nr:hypothetical protein [Candidatus Brocadiaceae bacterium]
MIKEIEIQEVFFQHETVGYPENGTRCGDSDVLLVQVGGKLAGGGGFECQSIFNFVSQDRIDQNGMPFYSKGVGIGCIFAIKGVSTLSYLYL